MTKVYGQIESLTKLKEFLHEKGIDRFNSVGEIKHFIKNYENERQKVFEQTENELAAEIDHLKAEESRLQKEYDTLLAKTKKRLNEIVLRYRSRCELIQSKNTENGIQKTFYSIELTVLSALNRFLKLYSDSISKMVTCRSKRSVRNSSKKIIHYTANRKEILRKLLAPRLDKLAYTKEVVDGLESLIAGAIGENLVAKELQKLPETYILFNDFSIDFKRPVYYQKEKSNIYSIQIDHLLVTSAGIFIIETKNWSEKSIERLDFRSPIKQIKRTNFALYSMVASSKELVKQLDRHHWGEKTIPVRNLVVLINHKPKEKFKFVKILALKELNGYITYFEPIFNDAELNIIAEYLKRIEN
jgi:hypothetical protein